MTEGSTDRLGLRGDWPWVAALWLATAVFFFPVLFGGQSFWMRDTLFVYYPQAWLTRAALLEGELPLWEPGVGFGYPFAADPHSMVFYPLTLLLLALPMPRGYDVFVVAHVALLATFSFLLLRRWELGRPAAALGAAVAAFCGFTVSVTCLTTLLRGATWAPLALLAFDGFLAGRGWRYLVWTGVVLAISGSGTDPHYVLLTAVLLAAARWLRPAATACPLGRSWLGVAAASALALVLLAYQYLPMFELLAQSDRRHGVPGRLATMFDLVPANLYNLALPLPFPDSRTPEHLASYSRGVSPLYADLYFGLPVLALAVSSLLWLRGPAQAGSATRRGRTAACALGLAAAGLALSLGQHTPVYGWLIRLVPPLEYVRYPGKYFLFCGLLVGVAAAHGFEGLLAGHRSIAAAFRGCLLGAAALVLALLVAVLGWGASLGRWFADPAGTLGAAGPGLYASLGAAWSVNLAWELAVCLFLAALTHLARSGKLDARLAPSPSGGGQGWGKLELVLALAGLVVVGDLALATRAGLAVAPDVVLAGEVAAARVVTAHAGGEPFPRFVSHGLRSFGLDGKRSELDCYLMERELLFHLRGSLQGTANLLQTMSVGLATGTGLGQMMAAADPGVRPVIARAAGARFCLEAAGWTDTWETGTIVGRAGPVQVRDLGEAAGRAFIPARAVGAAVEASRPSTQTVLALPGVAVFENPSLAPGTYEELRPEAVRSCRLTRYGRRVVEMEVDLQGQGLLVLLDAHYPGWVARVDGRARELVKVAGLFRGVRVSGRDRRVEFQYEPVSFRVGAAVSLAALVLTALALGLAARATSRAGARST